MTYQYQNPAAIPVEMAEASERAAFIRRTYLHLALALMAFAGLETVLIMAGVHLMILSMLTHPYSWLLVLGGFAVCGWIARSFAAKAESIGAQYFGLTLYVVAEAIIFLPMIGIALRFAPDVLAPAVVLTAALFLGLTAVVFVTRKDFSFLRGFLMIGGFIALGLIVVSVLAGGFTLGVIFSGAMIVLASASILYDTSNILHHYRTDQHVGAALELFASVALLFWYVLRILMAFNRR